MPAPLRCRIVKISKPPIDPRKRMKLGRAIRKQQVDAEALRREAESAAAAAVLAMPAEASQNAGDESSTSEAVEDPVKKIGELEEKLDKLNDQKHVLFSQLKVVIHEDEKRRLQLQREAEQRMQEAIRMEEAKAAMGGSGEYRGTDSPGSRGEDKERPAPRKTLFSPALPHPHSGPHPHPGPHPGKPSLYSNFAPQHHPYRPHSPPRRSPPRPHSPPSHNVLHGTYPPPSSGPLSPPPFVPGDPRTNKALSSSASAFVSSPAPRVNSPYVPPPHYVPSSSSNTPPPYMSNEPSSMSGNYSKFPPQQQPQQLLQSFGGGMPPMFANNQISSPNPNHNHNPNHSHNQMSNQMPPYMGMGRAGNAPPPYPSYNASRMGGPPHRGGPRGHGHWGKKW